MTPAHARLILEALHAHAARMGGDAEAVARTLARRPAAQPHAVRQAREDLERGQVFQRGGFLTPYGRALAYRVGAAVHNGRPLPHLGPL